MNELRQALIVLEKNQSVKVIIVSGSGKFTRNIKSNKEDSLVCKDRVFLGNPSNISIYH